MTAASPEAAVEAAIWLETYSVASEELKAQAAAAIRQSWLAFDAWYEAAAVAALAAETANLSLAAQQAAAGLSQAYAVNVISSITGAVLLPNPRPWQTIRNGVDMRLVHHRPAEAYKRAIARGKTHEEALVLAGLRAEGLIVADLSLEERAVTQAVLRDAGITTYRRVIRPELSKSGTCGMCIVAADQVYHSGDLMPIHPPSCKCVVMPIIGDNDPGHSMNKDDLAQLYEDAGSNRIEDLVRTRYKVNEHGELGPVLTKEGDNFRGPNKVALEDDPDRAARMLAIVLPVLADLEGRDRNGEDVAGPLAYQRELIARLRRIVGA